ncbi:MAG: sigma-70 family RNA polymerase sigma factor [Candidatus Zixiibacteriota bacterium]|nr:MAG: sigma-70 family RNA polymerase sigma factor [candidate division Zixibacteria bacterium]
MREGPGKERSAGAIEDQVLVERVLGGDNRAFEKLVEKYKKRIYYLAYKMTRDHDSADELAQESFVKAYQALSRFKKGYSFYTWIYRICVNLSINFLKKERNSVSTDLISDGELLQFSKNVSNQLESMITSEQATLVKEALERIPPDQKAVFILRTYENMTYEEIATVMSCSIGTVMSRLFRARHKLRGVLAAAESEKDISDENM